MNKDNSKIEKLTSAVRQIDKELHSLYNVILDDHPDMLPRLYFARDQVRSLLHNSCDIDFTRYIISSNQVLYGAKRGIFLICSKNQYEEKGKDALMQYKKFNKKNDSVSDFIQSYFQENPDFYQICKKEYFDDMQIIYNEKSLKELL